jgi:hypothetical protein
MTKKSATCKSPADSGPSPESASPCPVGYGRPPRHGQFKPGVSGNRKGRPKGLLNLGTVLTTELNRQITIREGNRSRRLSKGGAFYVRTINSALNNDKAGATLINLLRAHGMIAAAPDDSREAPRTQNDAELVADFLERELEARNQPDGKERNQPDGKEDDTPKEGENGRDEAPKKDKTP